MSVVSRKGFLEIGRPFVVGLGRAGLGRPLRFLKGLLDRRGEGPLSGREKQGSVTALAIMLAREVIHGKNWLPAYGDTQVDNCLARHRGRKLGEQGY